MKGRINKGGLLCIQRASEMKTQTCPHAEENWCGDWCPQFGEPEEDSTVICHADIRKCPDGITRCIGCEHGRSSGKVGLAICQGRTLIFDEFTDEREVQP